jgi:hypothetical protein
MTRYLTPTDPSAEHAIAIMKRAFPSYTGKKFSIRTVSKTVNCASSWAGGSRSYFRLVALDAPTMSRVVPPQSMFDSQIDGIDTVSIPIGIVKHTIFCGRDMGLSLLLAPENATSLLPESDPVTSDERAVLQATATYKNSYGGRTDIRFHESGLTREVWDAAQTTLIARKLLRSNGSITPEGRNHA